MCWCTAADVKRHHHRLNARRNWLEQTPVADDLNLTFSIRSLRIFKNAEMVPLLRLRRSGFSWTISTTSSSDVLPNATSSPSWSSSASSALSNLEHRCTCSTYRWVFFSTNARQCMHLRLLSFRSIAMGPDKKGNLLDTSQIIVLGCRSRSIVVKENGMSIFCAQT